MSEIKLFLRTADKARKAEIMVEDKETCADIIQGAVENWALPADTDYTITNVTRTPPQALNPFHSLFESNVQDNDTLEIQPVLVAGMGQ